MSDIAKMKVADLKKELGSRGLDVNGKKAVLVARLKESLSNTKTEEDIQESAEKKAKVTASSTATVPKGNVKSIAKMKVADLKKELGIRGLDVNGKKAVLVARLKESLLNKPQQTTKIKVSSKQKKTNKAPRKKRIQKDIKSEEDIQESLEKKAKVTTSPTITSSKSNVEDIAPVLTPKTFIQRDKRFKTVLNMPSWKLVSWNVNGFRAVLKKGFTEYVKEENADIICLSEVKCELCDITTNFGELGYDYVYWNASTVKLGYSGTAVLSKHKPLHCTYNEIAERKTEGRIITLEFESFYLVHTYVPNSGENLKNEECRKKWDLEFRKKLHTLEENKAVIWTGDLNVAYLSCDVYDGMVNKKRPNSPGFATYEREAFDMLIKNDGFVDVYRQYYPDESDNHYTFFSYRGGNRAKNRGWRLDYWIVSPELTPFIQSTAIRLKIMGSDHIPVVLQLK